jgi:2-haloacid dehalogenase
LKLASASLLPLACAPTQASGPLSRPRSADGGRAPHDVRAVVFDLFTLFDPRTVTRIAEGVLGERAAAFTEAWRLRQFEYTWIRAAAGRYADFRAVTAEALAYAERAAAITLSSDARATLMRAYERLDPWPDTPTALASLRAAGLRLAPLANFTRPMIEGLLGHGGVRDAFDEILSVDRVGAYKPDPRAYAMGPEVLGLPRESIVFSAFGGWDAAGARWFGYPTFWVNRLRQPAEGLGPGPDATGSTLTDLVTWLGTSPP